MNPISVKNVFKQLSAASKNKKQTTKPEQPKAKESKVVTMAKKIATTELEEEIVGIKVGKDAKSIDELVVATNETEEMPQVFHDEKVGECIFSNAGGDELVGMKTAGAAPSVDEYVVTDEKEIEKAVKSYGESVEFSEDILSNPNSSEYKKECDSMESSIRFNDKDLCEVKEMPKPDDSAIRFKDEDLIESKEIKGNTDGFIESPSLLKEVKERKKRGRKSKKETENESMEN